MFKIRIDPQGTIYLMHKICDGEFTYFRKFNKFVESIQINWKVLVWEAFYLTYGRAIKVIFFSSTSGVYSRGELFEQGVCLNF